MVTIHLTLAKTLDWSNININSIGDYSSVAEDEELLMQRWHESASLHISADRFVLDCVELDL